jgi:hypothetical protein
MNNQQYNGWTNYETWSVYLLIDNDFNESSYWAERVKLAIEYNPDSEFAMASITDELEESHYDNMPELTGIYAQLLSASLGEVNWREIANHMVRDAMGL